jgi:hypothetical protein
LFFLITAVTNQNGIMGSCGNDLPILLLPTMAFGARIIHGSLSPNYVCEVVYICLFGMAFLGGIGISIDPDGRTIGAGSVFD